MPMRSRTSPIDLFMPISGANKFDLNMIYIACQYKIGKVR